MAPKNNKGAYAMSEILIPRSILNKLPTMVRVEVSKMSSEKQELFIEEYRRKVKSVGVAYVLWFVIGLHYIYLGKLGWQFFYWVTGYGFIIWAIIDLFRIPSLVRDYNQDAAIDVLRNLKLITG